MLSVVSRVIEINILAVYLADENILMKMSICRDVLPTLIDWPSLVLNNSTISYGFLVRCCTQIEH